MKSFREFLNERECVKSEKIVKQDVINESIVDKIKRDFKSAFGGLYKSDEEYKNSINIMIHDVITFDELLKLSKKYDIENITSDKRDELTITVNF